MDYKIIAVDTAIGQLTVKFVDSAGAELATYAVDVPIEDGAFITGDRLEVEIQQRAPVWLLERAAAISTISNMSHLEALVDYEYVASTQAVVSDTLLDIIKETPNTEYNYVDQQIKVEFL